MQQQMKLFHFSWTGVSWYIQWLAKCWTCRDHWRSYGWVRLGQVGSIMDGLLVVSWTLRNHIYWFLKLSSDWLSCSFHVAVPFLRWQWCFSLAKSFHLQSLLGQPSLLASFMAFSCLLTVPRLNIPARPRQLSLAAALSPLLGRNSSQSDVITWVKRFRLYDIFLVHNR